MLLKPGSHSKLLAPLALLLSSPALLADGVTVALNGSHIASVTAGGVTIGEAQLMAGHSTGVVTTWSNSFAITAADSKNLAFYFSRNSVSPDWEIALNPWSNANGAGPDFFLFEVGGDDSIMVAPRMASGAYGQDAPITGWTPTGHSVSEGPYSGQQVFGLSFKHSDLKRPDGSFLTDVDQITGVRVRSSGVDGSVFLAHNPAGGPGMDGDGSVTLHGNSRVWHPIEFRFQGPWATQTQVSPNPFLDYRLNVTFDGPQGQSFTVPGFFAGDGEGGSEGPVWKARFLPDAQGTWTATASFRSGSGIAIIRAPGAGNPEPLLDGVSTSFDVGPPNPFAPGFLKWGRLEYADGHYQKFADGPYFIKTGTNSPENILAYRGFDEVGDAGGTGSLHSFGPHVQDWTSSDPNFEGDVHDIDGKGIIGALNYLSDHGVNSLFAITMSLGGDSQDVHPFVGAERTFYNKTHYHVGRLHKWNTVFEHAVRRGIALHFGLNETETANENWLDDGQLGTERKLYYRELAARFAHLHAVKWTLCEENDYTVPRLREFADTLGFYDAYDHPITFHNHSNNFTHYNQIYGDQRFCATSLQYDHDQAGSQVEMVRAASAAAGHPMVVQMDENNPWETGINDTNEADTRKRMLFDILFSGGHVEWYAGWFYLPLGGDVSLEDFRTREATYDTSARARGFMEQFLPFWEMQPMDGLLSGEAGAFGGGEVFAKPGEVYAVYLPDGNPSGTLNLSGAPANMSLRWWNPRTGQFEGVSQNVPGGGMLALGTPPSQPDQDWVALVLGDADFVVDVDQISVTTAATVNLTVEAGAQNALRYYWILGSVSGTSPGFPYGMLQVPLNFDRYTQFTIEHVGIGSTYLQNTVGQLDAGGHADASLQFPAGLLSALVGSTMHHAYVLVGPTDYVSGLVAFQLVP